MVSKRRKKKRRAGRPEPLAERDAPANTEVGTPETIEEPPQEHRPEKDPQVDYCFSHPSFPYSAECLHCHMMLCEMCTFTYQHVEMCGECFEVQLKQNHRTSAWRGMLSAVCGVVALGAFTAYFLVPTISALLLQFTATFAAGMGVACGLAAQDFKGIGPRAGMTGAALSSLVLVVVVLMHLARIVGVGQG